MADANIINSLIAAGSGLLGTLVGGGISYLGQRSRDQDERTQAKQALAASLAAEIDAYIELMERRCHVDAARKLETQLRQGMDIPIRGFAQEDDEPLDQFPLFLASIEKNGMLGNICFDLARFYTLIAGVRTTCIMAQRGQYDKSSPTGRADLVNGELAVWCEALAMAPSIINRLKAIALL